MSNAIQIINYVSKRIKHYKIPASDMSLDMPERLLVLGQRALEDDRKELVFTKIGNRWHGSVQVIGK